MMTSDDIFTSSNCNNGGITKQESIEVVWHTSVGEIMKQLSFTIGEMSKNGIVY